MQLPVMHLENELRSDRCVRVKVETRKRGFRNLICDSGLTPTFQGEWERKKKKQFFLFGTLTLFFSWRFVKIKWLGDKYFRCIKKRVAAKTKKKESHGESKCNIDHRDRACSEGEYY